QQFIDPRHDAFTRVGVELAICLGTTQPPLDELFAFAPEQDVADHPTAQTPAEIRRGLQNGPSDAIRFRRGVYYRPGTLAGECTLRPWHTDITVVARRAKALPKIAQKMDATTGSAVGVR